MTKTIVNIVKEKIIGMGSKQKWFLLALAMLAIILVIVLVIGTSGINGEYSFYCIEFDGESYYPNEPGHFNITGTGKHKEVELYLDLYGDSVNILGAASLIYETDSYSKYRLTVDEQSGTLFEEKVDYLIFYYYPDRKDNGIIKVDGQGTTLYFEKNK